MKSSAAERRRPTPGDVLVALLVAAAAALLAFAVVPRQTAGLLTAVVAVDGQTVAVLPLYPPDAGGTSSFYSMDTLPYPLVLEYKTGAIRVSEARCPGQDCRHTGWVDRAGAQIVCLPNRLTVTITGNAPGLFDAVTG